MRALLLSGEFFISTRNISVLRGFEKNVYPNYPRYAITRGRNLPRYKKKITRPMNYDEFKRAVEDLPIIEQAFLSVLFFCGCRVSEAVALTSDVLNCRPDTIYLEFFRLKGSKQTDPQEVPRVDALEWLCRQEGDLFPFSRHTGLRIVKKAFPNLYPHYFRMNRVTKVLDKFGVVAVQNTFGLSLGAIESYVGKIDIKRVGKALRDEVA